MVDGEAGGGTCLSPAEHLANGNHALPAGTRIAEFIVEKVLGIGGFGIVYLAADVSLGRKVALKEYMPGDYAVRSERLTVSVRSNRHADSFGIGLRSFVNEAKLLARFDHPSLVKVHRYWEANGTAYMVMPFYEGRTLKDALAEMDVPPSEGWLREVLGHILEALVVIHAEQCFHRDIAPDNILMTRDGPVLLDFGAARRLLEEKHQAVTAILKRGYAPIEQYGQSAEMSQGAWTDLYALASVVHLAIMGVLPPPAIDRLVRDKLEPLEQAAQAKWPGRYGAGFLRAIDRALALKPRDRPQSVAEFLKLLNQSVARRDSTNTGLWRKARMALLGSFGLAAVIWLGWTWTGKTSNTSAAGEHIAAAGRAPPSKNLEGQPERAVKPPFAPARVLEEIVAGKSSGHAVSVVVEKGQVVIGHDSLRFKVRSSKAGYVYILMLDASQSHLSLLYPNSVERNNRIEADRDLSLPPPGWQFQAQGPAGTTQFVALVSEVPRDFWDGGLNAEGEFPMAAARRAYDSHNGPMPLFAGKAACMAGAACIDAYGAAAFSIEEMVKK